MSELTKIAAESLLFDMDFNKRLSEGETIQSVTSIVSTSYARVTGSTALVIGTSIIQTSLVQFRISAGTFGEQYAIAITILTSKSNTIIGEGLLRIE